MTHLFVYCVYRMVHVMGECLVKIFVTGGMGSGKSTLIDYLESKGAAIVYADKVGHENLLKPECKRDLVSAFGSDILDDVGEVNRSALASKAFSSPEATKKLDSITQPLLYEECLRQVKALEASHGVAVLEMAILDGRDDFYKNADLVVCVTTSPEVRISRLMKYRGISEEDARNRIARQVPEEKRRSISDYVLTNDGTLEDFKAEIDAWWEEIDGSSRIA